MVRFNIHTLNIFSLIHLYFHLIHCTYQDSFKRQKEMASSGKKNIMHNRIVSYSLH